MQFVGDGDVDPLEDVVSEMFYRAEPAPRATAADNEADAAVEAWLEAEHAAQQEARRVQRRVMDPERRSRRTLSHPVFLCFLPFFFPPCFLSMIFSSSLCS